MTSRWDQHFLELALAHARMSKDPSTQVGAVIVGPDREFISAGFNGFPRGIEDSVKRLNDRDTKLKLIVHAEMNAILAAARNGVRLKGATMYVTMPPCVRCSVEAIQTGISQIVAVNAEVPERWKADFGLSREILFEAGIRYREIPHV